MSDSPNPTPTELRELARAALTDCVCGTEPGQPEPFCRSCSAFAALDKSVSPTVMIALVDRLERHTLTWREAGPECQTPMTTPLLTPEAEDLK